MASPLLVPGVPSFFPRVLSTLGVLASPRLGLGPSAVRLGMRG